MSEPCLVIVFILKAYRRHSKRAGFQLCVVHPVYIFQHVIKETARRRELCNKSQRMRNKKDVCKMYI